MTQFLIRCFCALVCPTMVVFGVEAQERAAWYYTPPQAPFYAPPQAPFYTPPSAAYMPPCFAPFETLRPLNPPKN